MTAETQPPSAPVTASSGSGVGLASLRFDGVSLVFPDGTHALDDVSFEVRRGEFVAIVGPSGCGKSTCLRLASGLLSGHSGRVELADPGNIGYVFQDATLLPWRSVQKNIELFGELHGLDAATRKQRAAQAIALVGLSGFERSYPKRLSGGMKMRVSLARSLLLKPRLFLFDEPFGSLDEISRERLNAELLSLFLQEHFAGLFITHSIAEAVYLSTRVLVMSARPGRIVASFDVPFAYPRDEELRFDPRFAALSGVISRSLKGAHE